MDLEGYQYVWLIVAFIIGFFMIRMAVGIWASRRVSVASDYIVAGRRLPIYMVGASVMATWFAAETPHGGLLDGLRLRVSGGHLRPLRGRRLPVHLRLPVHEGHATRALPDRRGLLRAALWERHDAAGVHPPADDVLRLDRRPACRRRDDRQHPLPWRPHRAGHDPGCGLGRRLHDARRHARRHDARLHPDVPHRPQRAPHLPVHHERGRWLGRDDVDHRDDVQPRAVHPAAR